MSALRFACWSIVVAVGVGVEWIGHSGSGGLVVADLAVGLAFLSGGLLIWERERLMPVALLFVVAGLAWFLGTLAGSDVNVLASLGSAMLYAHRGPLTQLILAYPTGHLRSWLDRVVVAGAYVDGLIVSLAQNDALTIALVLAVVVAGALGLRNQPVELRRSRALASLCFALVAVSLVLVSVTPIAGTTPLSDTASLAVYEASLLVTAIGLTVWLLAVRSRRAGVADSSSSWEPRRARGCSARRWLVRWGTPRWRLAIRPAAVMWTSEAIRSCSPTVMMGGRSPSSSAKTKSSHSSCTTLL